MLLTELQKWFASNCDGDWEHEFGVKIGTLGNPGWFVEIDLKATRLAEHAFITVDHDQSDSDWIRCWVEESKFNGVGDPSKLEAILQTFIDWAKTIGPDWLEPLEPPSEEEQEAARDRHLWSSLGDEVGPETCTEPDCPKKRIPLSVKCRQHHFEMITHRPAPKL